jgi:hypothetical protein
MDKMKTFDLSQQKDLSQLYNCILCKRTRKRTHVCQGGIYLAKDNLALGFDIRNKSMERNFNQIQGTSVEEFHIYLVSALRDDR